MFMEMMSCHIKGFMSVVPPAIFSVKSSLHRNSYRDINILIFIFFRKMTKAVNIFGTSCSKP